jgi:predicted RNA-binding protein with PIN domain
MKLKHMFVLVSVPYLLVIFYNQIEYSSLKRQVLAQESVEKAQQLAQYANFITKQNSLFFDVRLQMYELNKKYRENILNNLSKATETVNNYTKAYNKAYNTMDLDKIGALQSNINKKLDELGKLIEESKFIFEKNKDDLELRFAIQKGIHAIAEARISF